MSLRLAERMPIKDRGGQGGRGLDFVSDCTPIDNSEMSLWNQQFRKYNGVFL
jgi:hypothetical protein